MQGTTYQGILARQPLAHLGLLTSVALVGQALVLAILTLSILLTTGILVIPLLIIVGVLLVIAGLVATGVRWTPLLGALTALGILIGGSVSQDYFLYHLTHPAEGLPFTMAVLTSAFALVAIAAGLSATVQNYRERETARKAPRWLPTPLAALGGFVLGAWMVALLVQAAPPASSTVSANGEGVVHMGVSDFTQTSVTISKGSKLRLVDDGTFLHTFSNGIWENTTPRPAIEAGAPSIQNVEIASGSIEIGPFNTAGTFHIYCPIHPGMDLTVIVQ